MALSAKNQYQEPTRESDEEDDTVENDNVLHLVQPKDTRRKEPHYTIGTNDFGNTVLKMHGDGGYTLTLTMNEAATLQMIRMLEASLPENDNA